jgi:hypothetical protein
MASKTKVTPRKEEMLQKEGPETPPDSPLLDRSNAAVKALIRTAKKRGYVTHDPINSLAKEVNSEQIEDVLAMFSEMGINVVESEEAETEGATEEAPGEPEEEESEGELVEVARTTPAETKKSEPGQRTDDPVRMYLREVGSVEGGPPGARPGGSAGTGGTGGWGGGLAAARGGGGGRAGGPRARIVAVLAAPAFAQQAQAPNARRDAQTSSHRDWSSSPGVEKRTSGAQRRSAV